MKDHWRVEVFRNGKTVIAIEPRSLCGRDLLPGDEEVVRDAAMNLLGFIGAPDPGSPATGEAPRQG